MLNSAIRRLGVCKWTAGFTCMLTSKVHKYLYRECCHHLLSFVSRPLICTQFICSSHQTPCVSVRTLLLQQTQFPHLAGTARAVSDSGTCTLYNITCQPQAPLLSNCTGISPVVCVGKNPNGSLRWYMGTSVIFCMPGSVQHALRCTEEFRANAPRWGGGGCLTPEPIGAAR